MSVGGPVQEKDIPTRRYPGASISKFQKSLGLGLMPFLAAYPA